MNVTVYLITYLSIINLLNISITARKSRIIHGLLARPGKLKYMINTIHDDEKYNCGGGIIDDYYIITAAHCFYNEKSQLTDDKITIVAGTSDIFNKQDPARIEVDVEALYIPDNYDHFDYPNDIAVVQLKSSLNVEENELQKLIIPTPDMPDLAGERAIVSGFGYDKILKRFNNTTNKTVTDTMTTGRLREARVLLYSNADCQKFYTKETIRDSYLCGKMARLDLRRKYGICDGDSGSPLVYKSEILIGLVSWSYGCDERKMPAIYTRISSFIDFIKKAMLNQTDHMIYKRFD